jgi:hypothetical protein
LRSLFDGHLTVGFGESVDPEGHVPVDVASTEDAHVARRWLAGEKKPAGLAESPAVRGSSPSASRLPTAAGKFDQTPEVFISLASRPPFTTDV